MSRPLPRYTNTTHTDQTKIDRILANTNPTPITLTPVDLTTLTTRQRNILQDRLNGHSWRTIANAYNITEATARGHHRAALNRIRQARKGTHT